MSDFCLLPHFVFGKYGSGVNEGWLQRTVIDDDTNYQLRKKDDLLSLLICPLRLSNMNQPNRAVSTFAKGISYCTDILILFIQNIDFN